MANRANAIKAGRRALKTCNILMKRAPGGATNKCWNAATLAVGYADEGNLVLSAKWLKAARAEIRRLKGAR